MKKFWKTLLGNKIYQSQNGACVYQNLTYRWLTLGSNTIQTLINRRKPSKPELLYLQALTFTLRQMSTNTCLLGLGGGGLAHFINWNDIKLTAVESNNEIIEIAKKYFMLGEVKNIEVIEQDAYLFVQQCTNKYKHLIIDIHDESGFPPACKNIDFFISCKKMLLPDSILAINLANQQDYLPIIEILNNLFNKRIVCIPVKKTANMVVIASNSGTVNYLINLFNQSKEVRKLIWDAKFGYIAEI
ncbi:MAG: hypothetical protein P1U74_06565 [Legionellaceae bacterium]|nr:hypothetical protein [Legionellaceae bacterium]